MTARPLVLIVEDNAIIAAMMRVALESSNYRTVVAHDGATALELVAQQQPDLVLQDLVLSDMDGVEFLERLRRIPGAEAVPVIVCAGLLSKVEEARNALVSFTDYLFKPIDVGQLLQSVRRLLPEPVDQSAAAGPTKRVLLVDDDRVQLKLTALQLRSAGFIVSCASTAAEAISGAEGEPPDAFLLDLLMPDSSGLELCVTIRRHPLLAAIPVVVASFTYGAFSDHDTGVARRMGANALVARTPSLDLVITALRAALSSSTVPEVSGDVRLLHDQFTTRLGVQLERQVAVGYSLSRRLALDAALLAVTTGAASLANEQRGLDNLVEDVLTRTMDAGGVTSGAIYLIDSTGTPVLRAQQGFDESRRDVLQTFLGYGDLLQRVIRTREGLYVGAQELHQHHPSERPERSGTPGTLIEPLIARGDVVGLLVIGASRFESMREWVDTVRSIGSRLAQAITLLQTLEALRSSEENFRSFFQELPIAVYRSASDGRIIGVNAAFLELCGYDPAESVENINWRQLFLSPEHRLGWQRHIEAGGIVRNFATTLRRRDGQYVRVSATMRVVRDDAGNILRFEGALADVSRQKAAEEKLVLSEAYFRQLFESNPFPMLVVEPASLEVLAANTAALLFFERTAEEFQRLSIDRLLDGFHESPEMLAHVLVEVEQSDKARAVRYRRRSGDFAEMELTSRRIHFGGRAACILIIRDVTDRELLQQQVIQAQKMEAVGLLAGGVAHDFNNLLTVMKTCGSMLVDDLSQGDPRRDEALEIVSAAERAAVLTRQLLAFSRHQVLDPKPFSVNFVITELERMLRRLIPANIEFILHLDPRAGHVLVDAGQFEQIIVNLAINARDAMPHGGQLRIATSTASDAELTAAGFIPSEQLQYVLLEVSDSGTGMDERTRARLFEPFFTTKPRGQGTGLGLSTVYGIIRQSGGQVRVTTELGKGTTFRLYFPRVLRAVDAPDTAQVAATLIAGHERILLVEDEEAVRRVVCRTLTSLGYTIIEARNGADALALTNGAMEAPDLVLSDVIMPHMDGFELVTQLQKVWPGLRVLFMSGYADLPEEKSALLRRMPFIQKPFLPAELAGRLRTVLAAPPMVPQ